MANPMESTDEIPKNISMAEKKSHHCSSKEDKENNCECNTNIKQESKDENIVTAYDVEEALKDVIDPELGINIIDLGLVYGISLDESGKATVDMTLTSPACPLTDVIETQIRYILSTLVEEVELNWVWLPPWGPEQITDDGKDQLRALGFNV